MLVKLSDAAWLVSRHERVVRRRLLLAEDNPAHLRAKKDGQVWLIDTEDLARLWTLDQTRLVELQERHRKSPAVMSAQIATLQAQVRALESRIARLEGSERHQTRYDDNLTARDGGEVASISPPAYKPPVALPSASPPALRMRHTSIGDMGTFDNRAVAARWLMTHSNFNEHTPKSWPGWRDVELEPRAVLQLALSLCDVTNHRITWRLHQCDDSACVCHELLGS